MSGILESVDMQSVMLVLAGVAGGGVVSYLIAKKYIHRPTLKFNLHPSAVLNRTDFGNKFRMNVNGEDLNNLCVLNLDIYLKGSSDVGSRLFVYMFTK